MIRAIIIGAGPGGLATALMLRAAGIEATVFERTAELREAGSGLTLWPNAFRALEYLGVAGVVRSACQPLEGVAIRSWHGGVLTVTPRGVMEQVCGGTGGVIHRAELLDILLHFFGRNTIQWSTRCTGFRWEGQNVTALFADGREECGNLLIGADGWRSVIAEQLVGGMKSWYAGYAVWRGVAEFAVEDGLGVMSMGPGAQFGCFPLSKQRVYWFASANAPEGSAVRCGLHKHHLLKRFGAWHAPIGRILEATDEHNIVATDVYERKSLRRWVDGRVALIGDAAHLSAPTLGQGIGQALEDATVLGLCLRDSSDIPAALRRYEARRRRRANSLVSQARWMGWLGGWEWRPACWLREQLIKRTPEKLRLQHLKWLCRFEANDPIQTESG